MKKYISSGEGSGYEPVSEHGRAMQEYMEGTRRATMYMVFENREQHDKALALMRLPDSEEFNPHFEAHEPFTTMGMPQPDLENPSGIKVEFGQISPAKEERIKSFFAGHGLRVELYSVDAPKPDAGPVTEITLRQSGDVLEFPKKSEVRKDSSPESLAA